MAARKKSKDKTIRLTKGVVLNRERRQPGDVLTVSADLAEEILSQGYGEPFVVEEPEDDGFVGDEAGKADASADSKGGKDGQ